MEISQGQLLEEVQKLVYENWALKLQLRLTEEELKKAQEPIEVAEEPRNGKVTSTVD